MYCNSRKVKCHDNVIDERSLSDRQARPRASVAKTGAGEHQLAKSAVVEFDICRHQSSQPFAQIAPAFIGQSVSHLIPSCGTSEISWASLVKIGGPPARTQN